MIVLIISPAGYTGRGPTFNGTADDATIVTRSTTPFLDAARALLANGVDPATLLAMRHAGQDHDALRSTVGEAAGLSVEDSSSKPVFRPYKPDGRFRAASGPPMRFGAGQVSGAAEQTDAPKASPPYEIEGGRG